MRGKDSYTPHDVFAKEVLSVRANAIDFFRGVLPEELAEQADLSSLTEDKTSYTDETLSEYFSDLVFTCSYRGKPLKLVLLFEHKSFVPSFPFYQLLRYFSNIWYQQMKDKEPLSVVLPIILYHGRRRWKKRALSTYLSGDIDGFKRFIPEFDYLLVDLSEFSHEEIKSKLFQRTAVQLWLLVQKYVFDLPKLKNNLKKIFRLGILYFSEEEGLRFLESLLRYVIFTTDIPVETIMDSVEVLPTEAKEKAMTTAERLIEKGREEGLQKGKEVGISTGVKEAKREAARKMMKEGLDVSLIVRVTGLTEEELRELQGERG